MSNPALHQQLTTLSQHVAQLEKAIESQIPHLTQPKALISLVSKIRKSLDAKLIAQTQQQLAECQCTAQQLKQSQQKLFLLMQRNPLAVIEWNARFEVINWNPAAEEMFGYSKSEALGCHVAELLMVESARSEVNQVIEALRSHQGGSCSIHENFTKNGKIITCEWYNTPLVDSEGKITGAISMVQDITARQQAEKALKQAKEELEIRVHQRTLELEQTVARLEQEICQSEASRKAQAFVEQRLQESEAQQSQRENQYQQILDSITEMVLVKGPKSQIVWANRAFRSYYNMTNEQLKNLIDAPFNEPDYTLQYVKDDAYVLETGQVLEIPSEPVTRYDGEIRLFSTVKSPIRNEAGEVMMTVGVSRDISEQQAALSDRQQAEEILRQKEAQYRSIFAAVTDGLIINDLETGTLVEVNPATCRMHGYSYEEFMSLNPGEWIHPESAHLFGEYLETIKAGKQFYCQAVDVRQDGTVFDVEVTGTRCIYNGKSHALAVVRDISDRKAALRQRQATEVALAESEAKFRSLVQDANDLIYALSIEGIFTYVSPRWTDILGHDAQEIPGQSFVPFIHPEDLPACHAFLDLIIQTGEKQAGLEFRAKRQDGSWCHLACNISPMKDANGNIIAFQGIARNMTERKQAEAEQARLLAILEATSDFVGTADPTGQMLYLNRAGRLIVGLGKDESLQNKNLAQLHPNWSKDTILNEGLPAAVRDGIWMGETALLGVNGQEIPLSQLIVAHKSSNGEVDYFSTIGRDISDLKQAEQALKEQARLSDFRAEIDSTLTRSDNLQEMLQQCTQAIVNHLDAAFARVWTLNEQENVLELQASAGLYTHINGDHSRVPVGKFKIGLIAQKCRPHLTNSVQTDPRVSNKKWAIKEGMVAFAGYPLIVENQLLGVVALFSRQPLTKSTLQALAFVANEISLGIKRKQAEEALRLAQERLEYLLSHSPGVIYSSKVSGDYGVTFMSNNAAAVVGYDAQAFLHDSSFWASKIHPEDAEHIFANFSRLFTQGYHTHEYRFLHQDGTYRWVHDDLKLVKDQAGNPLEIVGHWSDVTERKMAEEARRQSEEQLKQKAQELEQTLQTLQRTQSQLLQSEKMSSLGQLVAGVAHEINNPVNFIYGNITHTRQYTQDLIALLALYQQHYPVPVPEIQAFAEKIDLEFLLNDLPKLLSSMKVGADRIKKIVVSLRTFSRMDEAEVKAVDIHEGIDSTLMILQHRLKAKQNHPGIEVIKEYGDLPLVECYAGQLNQVFMNLLANALDALEERDEQRSIKQIRQNPSFIRICTEMVHSKSEQIIHDKLLEVNQAFLVIRIADNGPGMTETVLNRLFDPFFTTKPVGKGTGMGLAISYQIVTERHGGSLHCISSPGQGAEFVIKIPVKR